MVVICLKADLIPFVEAEEKEQLFTLPTSEQSTVTAYEEMELRVPHSLLKLWMVVSGPLDGPTLWKEPPPLIPWACMDALVKRWKEWICVSLPGMEQLLPRTSCP